MTDAAEQPEKCCCCIDLTTEVGIKGIFCMFILQTLSILSNGAQNLRSGNMVWIIDFIRVAVFLYLCFVMWNGFKNDNPLNRLKTAKTMLMCSVLSCVLCIVQLVWIVASFDTAYNWRDPTYENMTKDEKEVVELMANGIKWGIFGAMTIAVIIGTSLNLYWAKVVFRWVTMYKIPEEYSKMGQSAMALINN